MALLDDFNRANENPLTTTNWNTVSPFSAMQIVTNRARTAASSGNTSEESWKNETFGPDCYSEIIVVARPETGGRFIILTVRGSNSSNSNTRTGYRMEWTRGADCVIYRENGDSTKTELNRAIAPTFNDGDTVRLTAQGSTLTVTSNGATVVAASDSTYGTAGYISFGASRGSSNSFTGDDFSGATISPASAKPKTLMTMGVG